MLLFIIITDLSYGPRNHRNIIFTLLRDLYKIIFQCHPRYHFFFASLLFLAPIIWHIFKCLDMITKRTNINQWLFCMWFGILNTVLFIFIRKFFHGTGPCLPKDTSIVLCLQFVGKCLSGDVVSVLHLLLCKCAGTSSLLHATSVFIFFCLHLRFLRLALVLISFARIWLVSGYALSSVNRDRALCWPRHQCRRLECFCHLHLKIP